MKWRPGASLYFVLISLLWRPSILKSGLTEIAVMGMKALAYNLLIEGDVLIIQTIASEFWEGFWSLNNVNMMLSDMPKPGLLVEEILSFQHLFAMFALVLGTDFEFGIDPAIATHLVWDLGSLNAWPVLPAYMGSSFNIFGN